MLKFSVEAVAAMHAFRLKPCPTFHLLTGHKVYPGRTRMKTTMRMEVVVVVGGVHGWPVEVRFGSLES